MIMNYVYLYQYCNYINYTNMVHPISINT